MLDRRSFIAAIAAALSSTACASTNNPRPDAASPAAASGSSSGSSPGARRPRIVLRSSWQTVNIGDIGHTPGVLALLEKHMPEAEVRLWPSNVDNGVREMLQRRFPNVEIVEGPDAIRRAMDECDFLLHGSGPSLVAQRDVIKWRDQTGKPYGVYGITTTPSRETVEVLNGAKFVFFRDSVSMQVARERGVNAPVMEFGPDGAFGVDLRNDEAAIRFLHEHGLEEGRFLCVLSRLRFTPYWLIKKGVAYDPKKHARNEAMKEHDHAPLREAIIAVVRNTDLSILACPEDASQMAVGKENLVDPLPDDVKRRVVWRENYWLTDEALSVYVRSAGIFGSEMHSPIMCIGNGVPAIVCRFEEQTSKGYMWRDIGLGDWLFNFDEEADLKRVAPAVLAMAKDPAAAKAKAARARAFVQQRQRETMQTLRRALKV